MYAVVKPIESQWLEAIAETIENTFNSIQGKAIKKSIAFIRTYRFELTLTALATFFVLFTVYVLFFAPPMPPCVDGYLQP